MCIACVCDITNLDFIIIADMALEGGFQSMNDAVVVNLLLESLDRERCEGCGDLAGFYQ
jgi:hypothetical protein